jgi:hypothetical protein
MSLARQRYSEAAAHCNKHFSHTSSEIDKDVPLSIDNKSLQKIMGIRKI